MAAHRVPSFEELSSELGPALSRYLGRMVGNAADADELLQETLMRVAQGLPRFEGRSSPKTWAFRIATHVAIDFLRRSRADALAELTPASEVSDIDEEDALIVDEMNACVRQVIDGLPVEYRAPLVLQALEGRTIAEIAEVCEITVATAKVRVHRARARLREALDRQCDFYQSEAGDVRCDRKQPGGDRR
jgi:RNA polymerase sigma-70 factor (ECF subfamily)